MKSSLKGQKVYTTGQVGKLCNVSIATVNKWITSGELKGYRIPGSLHRRVQRQDLIEFLRAHGVPLEGLEEPPAKTLLVVTGDRALAERIREALGEEAGLKLRLAASVFEAGLEAEGRAPEFVLVDFELGVEAGLRMCQRLRQKGSLGQTTVIGLLPPQTSYSDLGRDVLDEHFRRPFDPELLVARLRSLVVA